MVVGDLLESAALGLQKDGIGDSYNEALVLLTYVLDCNKTYIYVHRNMEVENETIRIYKEYIARRAKGEPVAYIAGKAWFMSREFIVTPSVLIPRPETEGVVETTVGIMEENHRDDVHILDMCTGSGCIGISVADLMPNSRVDLVDIDMDALVVAEKNILKHTLQERVKIIRSDLFQNLVDKKYDFIVSNPPYVKDGDTENLDEEVRQFEPHLALFAGSDGLSFYRKIIESAAMYLNRDGYLILEAGIGQAGDISGILGQNKFSVVSTENDLNGIPRVITAKRNITSQ